MPTPSEIMYAFINALKDHRQDDFDAAVARLTKDHLKLVLELLCYRIIKLESGQTEHQHGIITHDHPDPVPGHAHNPDGTIKETV